MNIKKISKNLIISLIMLSVFLIPNSYAAEQNSHNNLKSLTINQEGLEPTFNKDNLNYYVFIKESINSLTINAVAEDENATVEIKGNDNLEKGDNTIQIIVKAKNGDEKIYRIIATKTNDIEKSDSFLQNIILENLQLNPDFEPYIFEYDAGSVAKDVNKILTFAAANQEGAKVKITGNDNLKVGENIINIKVTSEDNLTTKDYKIKVNKESEKTVSDWQQESLENTLKDNNTNKNGHIYNSIVIIVLIVLILLLAFVIIKKNKK